MTQTFRSEMFHGEDSVKDKWTHENKTSYCGIGDVCFMQMRSMLMDADYAFLKWFAQPMPFPKKLLEKATLPGNYDRMSLLAFMSWMHSRSPGEMALKWVRTVRIRIRFSALRLLVGIEGNKRKELNYTHRSRPCRCGTRSRQKF